MLELVKNPKILLLNEPLSNLDAKLRLNMREEIKRIQNETSITTVFVTHDQEEAMSISDSILLMKRGKIQQYGKLKELYKNPINRFTAEFIDNPTINTLLGEVKDKIFNDNNVNFSISGCEINDRSKNSNKDIENLGKE